MDNNKLWCRIILKDKNDLKSLQQIGNVELFARTLRKTESNSLIIEGYIPQRIYDNLKSSYSIRILGDVNKIISKASSFVSKTNRYKK